jgi:hypothetical protein
MRPCKVLVIFTFPCNAAGRAFFTKLILKINLTLVFQIDRAFILQICHPLSRALADRHHHSL